MKGIKIVAIIIASFILVFFLLGHLSSYIGWYGYKKWEYRKHSTSIEESMKRGVFVQKLNCRIDSFSGPSFKFEPFIEKGFKWGHHTSEETVSLNGSHFPFQLSYNYRPNKTVGILMKDDQFKKFDSSGWCLRSPQLPDTIILEIAGEGIKSGIIKVW